MENVVNVLRNTLSNDNNVRRAAEQQMGQWSEQPGFVERLLQMCGNASVDKPLQQVAAAFVKNVVWDQWSLDGRKSEHPLPQSSKDALRDLLVPALVNSAGPVRALLVRALKCVADKDWPDRWPKLVEQLMGLVQFKDFNQESHRVLGAMQSMRVILRRYQYLQSDVHNRKRWPLHRFAQSVLPHLLVLLERTATAPPPQQNQNTIEFQILILKCFWSCTQQEVPPCFAANPPSVKRWVELCAGILLVPMPENVQPKDPVERQKFCWWQLKKWASKLLFHLSSRHGIESDVRVPPEHPDDDIIQFEEGIDAASWNAYRQYGLQKKSFAAFYERNLLISVQDCIMNTLSRVAQQQFVAERVLVNCLRFAAFAVRNANLWRRIEPQADGFMANVLFRLAIVREEERRLFFEEPAEFVNSTADVNRLQHSAHTQALYVIKDLVKLRKVEHLHRFMTFLLNKLQTTRDPFEKDAVIASIGAMSATLLDDKESAPKLERVMEAHVFTELQNPTVPMLEWRCMWVLGRFWCIKWANWQGILGASKNVVMRLQSKSLPLRLCACEVLQYLINLPPVAEAVEQSLNMIVPAILAITKDFDSDEVMTTLRDLVEKYPQRLAPLALQLIPPVLSSFQHAIREKSDRAAFAAACAVEVLVTVVDELADHTRDATLWASMENLLVPFIGSVAQLDAQHGFFEKAIELACSITYEPPCPPSPAVWSLLQLMHRQWQEWAKDYTTEVGEVWDNYLTLAPDRCLQQPEIRSALLEIISFGFGENADVEQEEGSWHIMQSCLANARGHVDDLLPQWLEMIFRKIKQYAAEEDDESVVRFVSYALLFLWYNPVLTLQLFENAKVTKQLLSTALEKHEFLVTVPNRVFFCLGLSSILHCPAPRMPALVRSAMPQILSTLITVLADVVRDQKEQEALEKAIADADDEGDEFVPGGGQFGVAGGGPEFANDAHIPDDRDVADYEPGPIGGVDAELDDEDFQYAPDGFENDIFGDSSSDGVCHTLEKVDAVLFWGDAINAFGNSNPDVMRSLMGGLNKKAKKRYQNLVNEAKVRAEAKKLEEAKKNSNNNNGNNNNNNSPAK